MKPAFYTENDIEATAPGVDIKCQIWLWSFQPTECLPKHTSHVVPLLQHDSWQSEKGSSAGNGRYLLAWGKSSERTVKANHNKLFSLVRTHYVFISLVCNSLYIGFEDDQKAEPKYVLWIVLTLLGTVLCVCICAFLITHIWTLPDTFATL